MYKGLLLILYLGIVMIINDLIMLHFKRKDAKKCNYDCSKCKVYDCMSKECNKKRVEQ